MIKQVTRYDKNFTIRKYIEKDSNGCILLEQRFNRNGLLIYTKTGDTWEKFYYNKLGYCTKVINSDGVGTKKSYHKSFFPDGRPVVHIRNDSDGDKFIYDKRGRTLFMRIKNNFNTYIEKFKYDDKKKIKTKTAILNDDITIIKIPYTTKNE